MKAKTDAEIVYTAHPIEGDEWNPVESRVAGERLRALIEETMMPDGLAKSYTMADHHKFPYPDQMASIDLLSEDFFGRKPNLKRVQKELNDLRAQHKREFVEHEADVRARLRVETDEQLLKVTETLHPHITPQEKSEYEAAILVIRENATEYGVMGHELLELDSPLITSHTRGSIVRALGILNKHGDGVRRLSNDLETTRKLLEEGNRDQAVERFFTEVYRPWRDANLAKLEIMCRSSKENAGFWIARIVVPSVVPISAYGSVEEILERAKMPYRTIKI